MFGAICANRPVQTNLQILSPTQFIFLIPPDPPFSHIVVFLLPNQTLPPNTGAAVYIRFPSSSPQTNAQQQQQQPEFTFLGAIGNEKQSAIFRVRRANANAAANNDGPTANDGAMVGNVIQQQEEEDQDAMIDSSSSSIPNPASVNGLTPTEPIDPNQMITLGISLEPLSTIATLLEQLQQNQISSSSSSTTTTPNVPPAVPTTPALPIMTSRSTALVKPPPSTRVLAQRIIQNAFNHLASFAVRPAGAAEEMIPLKAFRDWWSKFEKRLSLDEAFLERDESG